MTVRFGQGVECLDESAKFGASKSHAEAARREFSYDGIGYTRPAPAPVFSDGRRPFWEGCKREAVAHLQLALIGLVTGAAVVIFATLAHVF